MLTCRTATVQRVVASETPNGEYKKVLVLKLYLKMLVVAFVLLGHLQWKRLFFSLLNSMKTFLTIGTGTVQTTELIK